MSTSRLDDAVQEGVAEKVEGFYVRRPNKMSKQPPALLIESDRLTECVKFYNQSYLEALEINGALGGWNLRNLDFLRNCKKTRAIFVVNTLDDATGLQFQPKIELLQLSSTKGSLDFASFTRLHELRAEWSPKFRNLDHCDQIKRVYLGKYKSKSGNLNGFPLGGEVEDLGLTQSNLRSLDGIDRLQSLHRLYLAFIPRLCDINDLRRVKGDLAHLTIANAPKLQNISSIHQLKRTLVDLELEKCNAIQDYSVLASLKNLKRLIITGCSDLPSIKFIESLPKLEFFSFVNTNVVDGDMTPCLRVPAVGFFKKRHYSHSQEEIEELRKMS